MSNVNCSVQFNVGDLKEIVSVELPCFVKSSKTALEMLGGDAALQSAFDSNTSSSSLQLRFPTKDQTRHNVQGGPIGRQGILIKIRRKKTDPTNMSVEVLGCVNKSFVFNNPSDYQFLPVSTDTAFYSSRSNFPAKPALEVVPQSFCRTQNSKGVQYLNLYENLKPVLKPNQKTLGKSDQINPDLSPLEAKEAAKAARIALGERKKHPDAGLTAFIRFQDDIPTSHPSGEYPQRWKVRTGQPEHRGVQIINQLKQLFQILPMMSLFQLKGIINLPTKYNYLFKDCLPYVAFCYSQGPFRGLWARFGYNPRAHPESRLYQSITFRLAPAVFQEVSTLMFNHIGAQRAVDRIVDLDTLSVRDISASELGLSGKAQHGKMPFAIFGRALKHQFNLQLYLLTDETILAYVSRMKTQPSCNHNNGWYTQTAMSGLRNLVLKTMSDRIDQFLAVPQPVFRRGPIINPTTQALLETFDPVAVTEYLNSPWREEGGEGESEEAIAPSAQLYWLKKYMQTSPLTYGDLQRLHEGQGDLDHMDIMASSDSEDEEGAGEGNGDDGHDQENEEEEETQASSGKRATRKTRFSSAARAEAPTIRRDKALSTKRAVTQKAAPRIATRQSVVSSSSSAPAQRPVGSFNFGHIEAFDVFGQEEEEEEQEQEELEEEEEEEYEQNENDFSRLEDEEEEEEEEEDRMEVDENEDDENYPHLQSSQALEALEEGSNSTSQHEMDNFMNLVQQVRRQKYN